MAKAPEFVEINNFENTTALNPCEDTQALQNCSSDIPLLASHITADNASNNPNLYLWAEKLLCQLAEQLPPEEALLEYIEQAECPDNDKRFLVLLRPLQTCLNRMPEKRGYSLEWCLNLVVNHLTDLPVPSPDNAHSTQRVVDLYDGIVDFYKHFVSEVSLSSPPMDRSVTLMETRQRFVLTAFLINLLGKPLVHLDLAFDGVSKCKPRSCAEHILSFMPHVSPNIMPVLELIFERKNSNKIVEDADWDVDPLRVFLIEEKVPLLGLANLIYLVFAEELYRELLPLVYEPVYLYNVGLHYVSELLSRTDHALNRKGLLLANALTKSLSEFSFPHNMLDSWVHSDFCAHLESVMVYSDVKENRELGCKILQSYVLKMDLKARYQAYLNLFSLLNHCGVKSVLITSMKDTIHYSMKNPCNCHAPLYRDYSLFKLLMNAGKLPDGSDHLSEIDHAVAFLNLIWFLTMNDHMTKLGLRPYAKRIKSEFLTPIKDKIDETRNECMTFSRQLQEKKTNEKVNDECPTQISVYGQQIPDLSDDEKELAVQVACNKLSILDMLLENIFNSMSHQIALEGVF